MSEGEGPPLGDHTINKKQPNRPTEARTTFHHFQASSCGIRNGAERRPHHTTSSPPPQIRPTAPAPPRPAPTDRSLSPSARRGAEPSRTTQPRPRGVVAEQSDPFSLLPTTSRQICQVTV